LKSLHLRAAGFTAAVILCSASAAFAGGADKPLLSLGDGNIVFSGGAGVLGLQADEYVYAASGSSNAVSHLIWQSVSPMLTGSMDVKLPKDWTFSVQADLSGLGDGYMEDYDWFGYQFSDFDPNDWTHRSQHPNTNLDWYFHGSMLVGRDFKLGQSGTVNVNAGLQYTDVQWTAIGGSYVYSDSDTGPVVCHLRGCVGTFPDTPGITYHQQLPALVGGVDFSTPYGAWTLGAGAHAGFIIGAHTTDVHWLRSRTVFDTLGMAPIVSVSAEASYKFSDKTSLVLNGKLDKTFTARGNAYYDYYDGVTPSFSLTDQNGDGLLSASLSASLKGSF